MTKGKWSNNTFHTQAEIQDSGVNYTNLAKVFSENTRGKPILCTIRTLQNTINVTTNKQEPNPMKS